MGLRNVEKDRTRGSRSDGRTGRDWSPWWSGRSATRRKPAFGGTLMPTTKPFTISHINIVDLIDPAQSIGAHLSSKLESFLSDERTLTDELCDMMCIWSSGHHHLRSSPTSRFSFDFTVKKTTQREEASSGADLELIITSPLGSKRCLLQAKVFDPITNKFRCDSIDGWNKLREQLIKSRSLVGDLAFLLIYFPASLLNGETYDFLTYEQGFLPSSSTSKPPLPKAFYGASVIFANDLIDPSGNWLSSNKVDLSKGIEIPIVIPFWKFLIRLFLCKIGNWSQGQSYYENEEIQTFRRLALKAGNLEPSRWEKAVAEFLKQYPDK